MLRTITKVQYSPVLLGEEENFEKILCDFILHRRFLTGITIHVTRQFINSAVVMNCIGLLKELRPELKLSRLKLI